MKTKHIFALIIVLLLFVGCSIINTEVSGGSKDKCEMPNVVGLTYLDAVKQLSDSGFINIEANREEVSLEDGGKWFVSAQSEPEGTQVSSKKKIVLSCIQETRVYFEIESDNNFMFSTYDVVVSLDNTVIMTIPNGETRTSYQEIMEGEHTLSVCSAENSEIATSITIHIEGETYYRCEIKHTKDSVKIKDIKQTDETIVRFLKVIDVQGMPLDKAHAALKETGFINVEAIDKDNNESIDLVTWIEDNYMVDSQSVAENKEIDKNDPIVLKCVDIDEYFKKNFKETTILDAEKILSGCQFSYSFLEGDNQSIDISNIPDEEKSLWIIQKTDWSSSNGATFTVQKLRIATLFDLYCSAKVYQTIRGHVFEHYLINTSNHLIVEWTSSEYNWGYYVGDLNGLFYLVTGDSCGKCNSWGSSSSFTHLGIELFGERVRFTVEKPWSCEKKYDDIVASRPADISNYTEIHAYIDGAMLLIKGTDYTAVMAAGKKMGWTVESDGTKLPSGELECVMNAKNDGLKIKIRYSPSTKELMYFSIDEYEARVSATRKKEIITSVATMICSPEDADAVKAWVSESLSATRTSEAMIHGVPYNLVYSYSDGSLYFSAGFYE